MKMLPAQASSAEATKSPAVLAPEARAVVCP
jgi:hypothetical protein